MWTLLIAALGAAALAFLNAWEGQSAQGTGAALATAQTSATAVAAETAIAAAEVAAPTTQAALIDRLKSGAF